MTSRERAAYAAGIEAVVDIARQSVLVLRPKAAERPVRYEIAIEALEAIADAGRTLIAASMPQAAE